MSEAAGSRSGGQEANCRCGHIQQRQTAQRSGSREREHGDQVVKGTTKEPMASAIFFYHYYSIQNSW